MRVARRQRGFVLAVTLVLILLAAVALTGLARRSLTAALDANEAADRLRRRWAARSIEQVVLPRAERLLAGGARPGSGATTATPHRRFSLTLGGQHHTLVITDEQAKANINHLAATEPAGSLRRTLRRISRDGRLGESSPLELRLRPLENGRPIGPAGERPDGNGARYRGFGQVYAEADPQRLLGTAAAPGPARRLTCWGNGRLHFARSDAQAIRAVVEPILGGAATQRLLERRDERNSATASRDDPAPPTPLTPPSLNALLEEFAQFSRGQRSRLTRVLTNRSLCHGLWVISQGRRRAWYQLTIMDRSRRGPLRRYRFIW